MRKLMLMGFAVMALVVTAKADGESANGTFVLTDPDRTSFWHTATNNVIELPIWYPAGATSASLDVRGIRFGKACEGITAQTFTLTLPKHVDPSAENVYDLTLTFDDGTVRTAKLGLVMAYGVCGEGRTRCVFDTAGAEWSQFAGKAVFPVPHGTRSLSVNGETVDAGLDGAQGWYAVRAN